MKLSPAALIRFTQSRPGAAVAVASALLILQNLSIFWNHYFHDYGFPWDFPREYYAVVVFWTSAVQQGIFPQWAPFSSMGLPFQMHLQSGLYYPPLWLFPLLKIPYSLNAAVVFQCLHVLLGALGMFFFLRSSLGSSKYAFVGAFIFQFFGGFYSNSEHTDIIRGFALTPWMLYAYTFLPGKPNPTFPYHRKFAILIPGLIFLFISGSYPGIYLAGLFLTGVYSLLQCLAFFLRTRDAGRAASLALSLAVFSALGLLIASIYLGPVAANRGQIVRFSFYQDLERMNFELSYLPSLIFSNVHLPGEVSMNSIFITAPPFLLLFFLRSKDVKEHLPEFGMLLLSGTMALGSRTFVWTALSRLLFPLQISRFPSSDYRAFFAIFLIFFALLGLKQVQNGEYTPRALLARLGVCAVVAMQLFYMTYKLSAAEVTGALVVLAATAILVASLRRSGSQFQGVLLGLLVLAIFYHGMLVLGSMKRVWVNQGISSFYEGKVASRVADVIHTPPETRPPREPASARQPWAGYLSGKYMLGPGCLIRACGEVSANPAYMGFMSRAWTPLLFSYDPQKPLDATLDPGLDLASGPSGSPAGQVVQRKFGVNEVVYTVDLQEPALLVENELYFPGWQGEISGEEASRIRAVPVNEVFRGWVLPAGTYSLITRFELPGLKLFSLLSAAGAAVWLLVLVFSLFYKPQPKRAPVYGENQPTI